jgi:hypothetical protein
VSRFPLQRDAEVAGDAGEPGTVALADGAELPVGAGAVHLAEDHRGLGRGVLGQVVAGDLGCRLLKKMKCCGENTVPAALQAIALESRSKACPSVVRASQPRPTTTALRPGASLVSEMFPPLVRLMLMMWSPLENLPGRVTATGRRDRRA